MTFFQSARIESGARLRIASRAFFIADVSSEPGSPTFSSRKSRPVSIEGCNTLHPHPDFFERSLNIFLGIGAPANRPMLPLPWMLLPPLLLPELEQLLHRDLLTLLVVNLTHLFPLIVSPKKKKNEQTKHFAVEQKITSSNSTSILGPL